MRKRKKETAAQEAGFSMTPLIDIVFLLLIFFLLMPVKNIEGRLENPMKKKGGPSSASPERIEKERLSVVLKRGGPVDLEAGRGVHVKFMNKWYDSVAKIEKRLSVLSEDSTEQIFMEMNCGLDVPFKFVIEMMNVCRKCGIRDIRFSRI